jgi:hypothetical protein
MEHLQVRYTKSCLPSADYISQTTNPNFIKFDISNLYSKPPRVVSQKVGLDDRPEGLEVLIIQTSIHECTSFK